MTSRRAGTVAVVLGFLLIGVAVPASASLDKSISSSNLKTLENNLSKAKHLTYEVVYKSVSAGQTTTVTIAQAPPKSYFSTSSSRIIDNGKKTYFCSSQGASVTCLPSGTGNSLLGLEDIFSPAAALSAFSEAKEGLVSKLLGIKVNASSGSFGGQSSTCVSVTYHGKGGKYCVTKKGLLSYAGSSSSYFEMTKYSSSPPSSLFTLPAGATTETLPGGVTIP